MHIYVGPSSFLTKFIELCINQFYLLSGTGYKKIGKTKIRTNNIFQNISKGHHLNICNDFSRYRYLRKRILSCTLFTIILQTGLCMKKLF